MLLLFFLIHHFTSRYWETVWVSFEDQRKAMNESLYNWCARWCLLHELLTVIFSIEKECGTVLNSDLMVTSTWIFNHDVSRWWQHQHGVKVQAMVIYLINQLTTTACLPLYTVFISWLIKADSKEHIKMPITSNAKLKINYFRE